MKQGWLKKLSIGLRKVARGRSKDLRYALCERSFFPEILPPIVSSTQFADVVLSKTPPDRFVVDFSSRKPKFYKSEIDTFIYRRPANQRRNFGIVNPVPFYALVHEIANHWNLLHRAAQSDCSVSSPSAAPLLSSLSAIQPRVNSLVEHARKLDIRTHAKFLVKADITRFYPSIYTHSIAWVLEGKANAKSKKQDYSKLGNRLDILCRNTQDGQTLGVSIGQDVFRIFAEIILSEIDKINGFSADNCYRYSDDYEIACGSYSEAEKVIAKLEKSLHEYGLALNHSKTRIIGLPQRIEEDWISRLTKFEFDEDDAHRSKAQLSKISKLFDTAFDILTEKPTTPALSYAISMLPGFKVSDPRFISDENIPSLERYLAHAITIEPGCISRAIRYISILSKRDEDLVRSGRFQESLSEVLQNGTRLGIDSDIAWALYGHIVFNKQVSPRINVEEVIASSRSIPHVLMIAAYLKGIWKFDISLLQRYVDGYSVYSSEWLTVYELARHGLCGRSVGKISETPELEYLLNNNVSFLDTGRDEKERITEGPVLDLIYDEAPSKGFSDY